MPISRSTAALKCSWFVQSTVQFGDVLVIAPFYGDAVITPAISVLSAVEGIEIVTPALEPFVVPVTLGILVALFYLQGECHHKLSRSRVHHR
jgi:K+ transporter